MNVLAQFHLKLNLSLKEKLQTELQELADKCIKINETRKFNQVIPCYSRKN